MTTLEEEAEGAGLGGSGVLDVSRSGRVRKKNSLLAAYESLDEVDKPKKKGERVKRGSSSNQKVSLTVGGADHRLTKKGKKSHKRIKLEPGSGQQSSHKKLGGDGDSFLGEGDLEMDLPPEYNDHARFARDDSPGYSSSDIDDRTNGNGRFHSHQTKKLKMKMKTQAQSTYMMEKEKTFVVQTNRKSGPGKAKEAKKEKGSPRVTAYTLWAKDQREFISKKYPHLDAASLSRKLSEIWQTSIPPNQRKMWKNKADKLMRKNLNIKNSAPIIPPPGKGKKRGRPRIHPIPTGDLDSFGLNGSSSAITPIRRIGNFKSVNKRTPSSTVTKPDGKRTSVTSNGIGLSPKDKSRNHLPMTSPAASSSPFSTTKQLSPRKEDDFAYKVTGTAPIDVAAHFALLGESLSIIGERLMDVERQPVSGSLSVLMDSLLCAITPLVCLTQQVPELNCIPPERLTRLLDHIAYIMPGL